MKYYNEDYNHMVGTLPYPYRYHGDSVLKFFSLLDKERIRCITWDPETRQPVLATESMAGKTYNTGSLTIFHKKRTPKTSPNHALTKSTPTRPTLNLKM